VVGRMLVRVDNHHTSHRATVQVCAVASSADRASSSSRAACAARREANPPRRTRSIPTSTVGTEQWKYQEP
jgi:hypothetical protein